MKLIYSPEGATKPREWEVKPGRLDVDETIAIEEKTGLLFGQWQGQLLNGGAKALKGLVWTMMRRDDPTLRWDQVQFAMADVVFDFDDEELRGIVDSIDTQVASGELDLTPMLQAELDGLRLRAYVEPQLNNDDQDPPPGESAPKASRSKKSSGSTSSTSPKS